MRTAKANYPEFAIETESTAYVLAQTQRQAEEWESSVSGKKRKASGVPCWHGEAVGRLTRSRASYVIG